jgi:hypothetical protein
MPARTLRTALALGISIGLLMAVPGCWNPFKPNEDKKPTPTPPVVDRSTRVNLMQFFAKAHEDRKIDDYGASLHPDYVFEFSEEDRNDPGWNWTDWIKKAADVEVTTNMFTNESVSNITVEFVNLTNTGSSDPEDNFIPILTGSLENDPIDTLTVMQAEFKVDMHVIEEKTDQNIDHWVDGRAHISLVRDPVYEDQWTIWKIKDLGNEPGKGESKESWSALKKAMR